MNHEPFASAIGGYIGRVFDGKTIISLALIGCTTPGWRGTGFWTPPRGRSWSRPWALRGGIASTVSSPVVKESLQLCAKSRRDEQ